jgi:hypothetical protein
MKNNTQKGSIEVVAMLILVIGFIALFIGLIFFKLDWKTGEHGRLTITAVDKNLFGTYTIYARNSESMSGNELMEVKYCIDADNTDLANFAKESVGKQNVKLVYPEKRIGFMWFDKCGSAPIKEIILTE